MTESLAWMNGEQLPFSQMHLPVWDLGVVAGASLTEMARTFLHRPFRLREHLQRLVTSCDEIGFQLPYADEELLEVAETLVAHNVSLIDSVADLGIVIFVTAGANPTYLAGQEVPGPTVGIHTFPLPLTSWKAAVAEGVRLRIVQRRQIGESSLPVHLKTRNRLHWWLADREANAMENSSRALMLNNAGHLTETSTSCFFAVIKGEVVTPRMDVLNSMSRRMVEEAATAGLIPFRAADIEVDDVAHFESAFLSSTPVGILPVRSINDVQLNGTVDSALLTVMRRYWQKQTGLDPTRQILDSVS